MNKNVLQRELLGYPPQARQIFDVLEQAGAENFALFGGAARDADYAVRQNKPPRINDYDIRVWFAPATLDSDTTAFVEKLKEHAEVIETPSVGTGRIRYCLNLHSVELDISVRVTPAEYQNLEHVPVEAVAIDRALDADIGLCSIAIDPLGRAWSTDEYEYDQTHKTLTVYPIEDVSRRQSYAARMQRKFPENRLIWLSPLHTRQFNPPILT